MPSSRLIAVITALTCLAGASGAYAAYTVDQLREIERMIVGKDCEGLRRYIGLNPILLQGADPLAVELRTFASGVDTGLIDCFSQAADTVTRGQALSAVTEQQY